MDLLAAFIAGLVVGVGVMTYVFFCSPMDWRE
jgi:hypothetical protein